MYQFLNGLPRWIKGSVLLVTDLVLVAIALFAAYALRLNDPWPIDWFMSNITLLTLLLGTAIVSTVSLQLHVVKLGSYENSAITRIALWAMILTLVGTICNATLVLGAPRTVPIIFGALIFLYSLLFRLGAIWVLSWLHNLRTNTTPVAVYGAGAAGLQLISALNRSTEYRPVLFVDDNKRLQGVIIAGLRVYSPASLSKQLESGRISKILLAMPSIGAARKARIMRELEQIKCEVLELPSYVEMIDSGGVLRSLRPVAAEDLLGRDGVNLSLPEVTRAYAGAQVMVTGAGGSIGSELGRRVMEVGPKRLVLFETSEYGLYNIERELRPIAVKSGVELVTVLGNVGDESRVNEVIQRCNVDVILHAAAYKHVPMIEHNEIEGVKNNVFSTKILAETAIRQKVSRFILVSTDKAVRPANVMGASKRLAELVVQDFHNRGTDTIFSIVRFGNVLGSSGSVIPLFKEQIQNGGPVTLTHEEVTRFFMTIPEAARLVLLAGSYAEGGEVFVLDMGRPVKIRELAENMVKLSGLSVRDADNPDGDIEIKVTGLRPGEKLYEELLIGENSLPTPHPKIMRARESSLVTDELTELLNTLKQAISSHDAKLVRTVMETWVEGYRSCPVESAASPTNKVNEEQVLASSD